MNNRIKEYREKFGLTQKELADKVEVNRETIVRIENNCQELSLQLALRIASCFDTTIEKIFLLMITNKTEVFMKEYIAGAVSAFAVMAAYKMIDRKSVV